VPIFPKWKDYKNQKNLFKFYIEKVAVSDWTLAYEWVANATNSIVLCWLLNLLFSVKLWYGHNCCSCEKGMCGNDEERCSPAAI
jgi:hypothetical protein